MSLKKYSSFERKKNKSNLVAKMSSRSHRCIVTRSNVHMYATVVDSLGNVVFSSSDKGLVGQTKKERSSALGMHIASHIKKSGVDTVVFDRNGYLYHGRVAALCDGLREGGITI